MVFKKSRDEVLEEIKWRVHGEVNQALSNFTYNGQITLNNLMDAIKLSVANGVTEGFRCAIENQYTTEDFERDMTLKD